MDLSAHSYKVCAKCQRSLHEIAFRLVKPRKNGDRSLSSICKECSKKIPGKIAHKRTSRRNGWAMLLGHIKYRSKRRGREFDLTPEFIMAMFTAQKGLCALTGMQMIEPQYATRQDWAMASVDRIELIKGYTQSNVQLTTVRANRMRGEMTIAEFIQTCGDVLDRLL